MANTHLDGNSESVARRDLVPPSPTSNEIRQGSEIEVWVEIAG